MKEIKVKIPEGCKVNSVSTKVENGMVVVTYEPKDEEFKFGDYVVFDNEEGLVVKGVLKEFDRTNDMFVIFDPSDRGIFHSYLCGLRHANEEEVKEIKKEMADKGYSIDYDSKQIVKDNWRANFGKDYLYIRDTWGIMYDTDDYSHIDDESYKSGNYFKSEEEAGEAAKRIKEVLKQYHKEIGH